MKLFNRECRHDDLRRIGFYYKETLSEWRNDFDRVYAYVRYKCRKCGKYKDVLLGSNTYVPELFHKRDPRKDEYIKQLQSHGYKQEYELAMLDHTDMFIIIDK